MRMPVRPSVRRSAAALNRAMARRRTRRCLVAAGVSARRRGGHLRISRTAVNLITASTIRKVSSSPKVGSTFHPPSSCEYHHCSQSGRHARSEEHTSELQSLRHLVCRLLLEKKNLKSPP